MILSIYWFGFSVALLSFNICCASLQNSEAWHAAILEPGMDEQQNFIALKHLGISRIKIFQYQIGNVIANS